MVPNDPAFLMFVLMIISAVNRESAIIMIGLVTNLKLVNKFISTHIHAITHLTAFNDIQSEPLHSLCTFLQFDVVITFRLA